MNPDYEKWLDLPQHVLTCVSVVFRCVAAKYQHVLLHLNSTCIVLAYASTMHLHMQARCKTPEICSDFSDIFAWELHAYASPMQVR